MPIRLLPDGTPLQNRLLAALPQELYLRIAKDLRMTKVVVGQTLLEHGVAVSDVYFPNGGVYSITNLMRDAMRCIVSNSGAAAGCSRPTIALPATSSC